MKKLISVLAVLLFGGLAIAQNPSTGAYAFASFDNRGFDSINIGNLNTRFSIPIVNRPGRGIAFNYSIGYEGLIWKPNGASGTGAWSPDSTWGFRGLLNDANLVGYLTHSEQTRACLTMLHQHPKYVTDITNFVYYDQFGVSHSFNYAILGGCPEDGTGDTTIVGDGSTDDGSGYTLLSEYLVQSRDGSRYFLRGATGAGAASVVDRNGNKIASDGSGGFVDTLGVTALTVSGSNPRTFTYPVTLQSNSVTTASANVSYVTHTVRTNFQCPGITEYGSNSVDLVDRITLADGSYYALSYEGTPGATDGAVTARLASITLPTGGTISYTYTGGCSGTGINADGTVGSLTRTTSDGTRSYDRSPVNSNSTSTTLTDEKGNASVFYFTIDAGTAQFYETHRTVHQGNSSAAQIFDQYTCYNGAAAPCDSTAISLPITHTSVIMSYNGGTQSEIDKFYSTSTGLLTESDQTDRTNMLEATAYGYNAYGGLSSMVTKDGAYQTVSSTTYGYDEQATTITSGIPQHVTSSSAGGNQTSSHVWTGSGTIDSSANYYDTGVPVQTTSPNGQTSFSYDPTQTFVTQTTLPTPSSGVALSTSASYDQQSASPLSATGMNAGETAQVTQYDALLRPTSITLPNASTLSYSYSPTWTTVSASLGASTDTLFDSYGRVSRVAVYNGQSNPNTDWYQVDYCYDATGLLQFQSTRYAGPGFIAAKRCSGSGTSYSYDALGRLTNTATDDGSATNTYSGRAVLSTSVNGVQRITQYDLLGRISAICEVSSSTNMPGSGSPVSCGMDVSGYTGFLTTYAYDMLNHKTTITQGVQQRIFQTDAAGRTIYTNEPERGETTYSYSYNSNGLVVVRTRPKANQQDPTVKTNTTTQYDSLGRVTSISHDDNLTDTKYFWYDSSPGWLLWSTTPSNTKGRLAATQTNYGANTRSQFSYDLMGNVTTMWQCAPSICATGAQESRVLTFGYDALGNLTDETDPASGHIAYGRTSAGEISSVTNQTYTDPGNTPNLISNVVTGPFGPVSYSLGNGLSVAKTYDSSGRPSGGWICSGSSQPNCAGGGNQLYGWASGSVGSRIVGLCDTVINQCQSHGYDEFSRLTSVSGPNISSTYTYDRYGNRTQQTTSPSGPQPGYSFDLTKNRIQGLSYDAAGNMVGDGSYSYTYDADGKILNVNGGSTATYVYDAFNQRVSAPHLGTIAEYLYDPFGRKTSTWLTAYNFGIEGKIYSDSRQIAFRAPNGQTFFDHQDYLGTERMRTNYQGQVATTEYSLAFGDGYSQNDPLGYGNTDTLQFAGLDHDSESNTDHAVFRQYSATQGRWMSPDPYDGSYDALNPQSLNRYTYVLSNPTSYTDASGLERLSTSESVTVDGGDDDGWMVDYLFWGGGGSGGGAVGTAPAPNNVNKHFGKSFKCGSSASRVMGAVQSNFSQFANYTSWDHTESVSFSPPSGMGVGSTIPINVGTLGINQSLSVNVQSINSQGMTFTTNPGHLLYPASISFSASPGSAGSVNFSIDISGQIPNVWQGIQFYLGGSNFEDASWNHLLSQVQGFCKVGG